MSSLVEEAIEVLYAAKVPLAPGLSPWQIDDVEEQFSFEFSPDHARFLSLAMPIGPSWVDWLGDPEGIQKRLDWPRDGVLFDVRENAFWPEEWGDRPTEVTEALQAARERLRTVPTLIPIYSHRFMPAAPAPAGSPVFSVHQTDVIYYGSDLVSYFQQEFFRTPDRKSPNHRVDFWSELAEGQWI
ncbi:hypothetical protein [Arthrobacter sp. FW306-04-A]|uniref:hypothetical protein n=1 Tax=Arthrobacter sp. FW306-04-A TaxID=2879619 RepID=UPI0037BF7A3C|nr:hypothetical protein LFT43_10875 [Arthrobacter sp. FW306-04-A]